MKKAMVSCFLGAALLQGCASMQLTPTTQPMNNISEIIEVEGKTKDQIFNDSKMWMAVAFKSANNVIQYQDKDTGSIIGKGNIQYPCSGMIDCGAFGNDKVNFTIKIDAKDNKAKVAISDITRTSLTYVKGGINSGIGNEMPITIVEHQEKVTAKLKEVIQQYKTGIISNSNNW